jgi:tetratricopeptide (TPR) repeat protein
MIIFIAVALGLAHAAEQTSKDPTQLFYAANLDYEKRDYAKALSQYLKVLDSSLESGELYYNIGNSFFKLGKLGYAILYYERANRLMPQDSDVRSNLAYAKALTNVEPSNVDFVLRVLKRPFRDFSLNNIALSGGVLYILVVLICAIYILNRFTAKKFVIVYIIILAAFLTNLVAFALRFYDERILKHGIVLQKSIECKYEPIDKSTTYYTLPEGSNVIVLKTRNGWKQIKDARGKIAWVDKEAVEEI